MDFKKIGEYNILSLAYLGDAVWDLAVRNYFFSFNLKVDDYNNKVRKLVNAKSQSEIFRKIFPNLEEKYQIISKRGKNANIKSFSKNCSITEYREATAFEVLIATYHLLDEADKIQDILNLIIKGE